MKKNRCCIITCYIGTLPKWMQQWLESCRRNSDFDFIVVTDDRTEFQTPPNVKFLYASLKELKERFQLQMEFPISLEHAYKLCDYKLLYGLAFQGELVGYEFWGHCDLDMLFGSLSSFITDRILDEYDRVGSYGALILYRNIDKINYLYREPGSAYGYKKVFKEEHSYNFDEVFGYNLICKRNGIAWHDMGHQFILDKYNADTLIFEGMENAEKQRAYWKDGRIYRIWQDKTGKLQRKEYMYFHFSKTHYDMKDYRNEILFGAGDCDMVPEVRIREYFQGISAGNRVVGDCPADALRRFAKKSFAEKRIRIRQEAVRRYIDWRYGRK